MGSLTPALAAWRLRLRSTGRTLAVLVVLLGLAGGAAIAAAAAARRTASAHARYLEASDASDLTIDAPPVAEVDETIAELPEVERVTHSEAVAAMLADDRSPTGMTAVDEIFVSEDGRFLRTDRLAVVDGRRPDPRRPNEMVVNEVLAAEQGIEVGDRLRLLVTDRAGAQALLAGGDPALTPVPVEVVGIVVLGDEVVQDDVARSTRAVLSPAFTAAHPDIGLFGRTHLHLRGGAADVSRVQAELQRAFARGEPQGTGAATFEVASEQSAEVQRGVRPEVAALAAFAALAALVALLVVGQAVSRHIAIATADFPTLRALGMGRRQLVVLGLLDGLVVATGGALLAGVVAIALSPLGPIGPVRRIEPSPGIAFDPIAVLVGVGALGALVALRSVVTAWRVTRPEPERPVSRPSGLVEQVTSAGVPVACSTGVRFALDRGRGWRTIPVRTTIAGAAMAVAAVLATAGFGAGLARLVETPRLYGWDFDVLLTNSGGYGEASDVLDDIGGRLQADDDVQAYAAVAYDVVGVDGRQAAALGLDQRKGVIVPPIVEGAPPMRSGEVAVGTETLRALDKQVGDVVEVRVGDVSRSMVVSGRAVFPAIGRIDGARTGLAEGVVLGSDDLGELSPRAFTNEVLVRFAPGVDEDQAVAALRSAYERPGAAGVTREVLTAQRPAEIVGSDEVDRTPLVLAALLGVVAIATLVHTLLTSVRRRRTDLALLKTLGFSRAQVLLAVAVQASTLAAAALVVAVPLGIAAGRWSWVAFATQIGAVPRPVLPSLVVVGVVLATLVVCNLVALVPGRIAARTEPAAILRSE